MFMKNSVFKADFEHRLRKLYKALEFYFATGNEGSLIPFLFQCVSACWTADKVRKISKRHV